MFRAGATSDAAELRELLGGSGHVEANCTPRPGSDPAGTDKCASCVARDVSAHDTPELQEPPVNTLATLGLLTASAAHDLNNAMTALRAHLYVAQIQLGRPQVLAESQSILDRCASLTSWLLSLSSRRDSMATAWQGPPADLRQCVSDALTFLRHSLPNNIIIQAELGEQPALARVDPELMSHAVLNLLLNARDALSTGGVITARLRAASVSQYQLTIEDDGVGMAEETLRRAAEPLFTTKGPGRGTGLGLPSVLRVVHAASGTVELASELGAGTCVTLMLPRARGDSP